MLIRLLNREKFSVEEASVDEEEDDFLKAFKVANFEYIDEGEAVKEELKKQTADGNVSGSATDRASYWDELLKDKYEQQKIEEFTTMGKGKRTRRQMTAAEEDLEEASSKDEDYSCEDDMSDTETSVIGTSSGKRSHVSKKRRENMESYPLMEGEGRSLRVLGFNQNQRSAFQHILMRFGFQDYTWKEFIPRLKGKSWQEIHNYGAVFMTHLCEGVNDSPTFSDGVPKEGAHADDIMARCGHIHLIEEKVNFMSRNTVVNLFSDEILLQYPLLNGRVWKVEHDLQLLRAVLKHGYARWQDIIEDEEMGINDIVRKELNIPSGPLQDSGQTNESSSPAQLPNEASDRTTGSQTFQHPTATLQSKELQKRTVDFIKKRYLLIGKALDMEFAMRYSKPCGSDQTINPEPPEENNLKLHINDLLKNLPGLENISLGVPHDNLKEQLYMAHLYNAMCRIVDGSALDSVQGFFGDVSSLSRMRGNLQRLDIILGKVYELLRQGQCPGTRELNIKTMGDGNFPFSSIDGLRDGRKGDRLDHRMSQQIPGGITQSSNTNDVEMSQTRL